MPFFHKYFPSFLFKLKKSLADHEQLKRKCSEQEQKIRELESKINELEQGVALA